MDPVIIAFAASVASDVAANFITWIGASAYNHLLKSDQNKYKLELGNLIYESVNEYREKRPNNIEGKIPFYESKAIFTELLKFRLTSNIDNEALKKAIENDDRIIVPNAEEIEDFLDYFFKKLDTSETLKELYVEHEWKKEIFNVSRVLKSIQSDLTRAIDGFKVELSNSGIAAALTNEWQKQLDEVNELLKEFKPQSALTRLENLEERLKESGVLVSNNIKAKVSYLKGICLTELEDIEMHDKSAKHFLAAYRYCPENPDYRIQAGLAYCSFGDAENMKKALEIAEEILKFEEYHHGAWVIKCYSKNEDVISYLPEVPKQAFEKREFKVHISHFLLQRKYINAYSQLVDAGLEIETKADEPKVITHRNRGFWLIMCSLQLNKFFEMNSVLTSTMEVQESSKEIIVYVQGLLNKVIQAVDGTEIEKKHAYFKYYLHYLNFLLLNKQEEVYEMEKSYVQFPRKSFLDVFIIGQALTSTGKDADIRKSIAFIDEFGDEKSEVLCIFKACNYLMLNEEELAKQTLKKFILLHKEIDKNFLFNVIEFYRSSGFKKSDQLKKHIDEMLAHFSNDTPFKELLFILLYSAYRFDFKPDFPTLERIEEIKLALDKKDSHIGRLIAEAFMQNGFTEEAINHFKPFIDFAKPSQDLILYCRLLNISNHHKTELLSILENWRKSFAPNKELLRMEVHLRQLNNNWRKIVDVCTIGFEHFPSDETFLFGLIAGYGYDNNVEKIKELIPTILKHEFENNEFETFVSGVLLKNGFSEESLEILYRTAQDKNNRKARQTFLTSTVGYPPEFFKDFEKVEVGSFVKYEFNNEERIIEVTSKNKDTDPFNLLLNKVVGDPIVTTNKIDNSISNGRILRIINKYVALCEQILIDAKDPLSSYNIATFKFDELTIESMNKAMVERFGVSGSIQQSQIRETLDKYYTGEYSFSEITHSLFNGNCIEAYFGMSSQKEKSFLAISIGGAKKIIVNEDTKYILDGTSLGLFFELSKDLKIKFNHKFVISPLLKQLIKGMIDQTRFDPEPKASLSITLEGVRPLIYQDDFKEKRLDFLNEIFQWVEENCEVDFVEDKLDIISSLPESIRMDGFIQYLADNALLAERPNYLLLSNDTFYFKSFQSSPFNIISPEVYLKKYYQGSFKEISTFMLSRNYVGIYISNEILQEELLKMLSNKENKFSNCLENLNFGWSPIPNHIHEVVIFLKWLYLLNFLSDEQRERIATQTLYNLIQGMSVKGQMLISSHIHKHFKLLGKKYDQVIAAYTSALKI